MGFFGPDNMGDGFVPANVSVGTIPTLDFSAAANSQYLIFVLLL